MYKLELECDIQSIDRGFTQVVHISTSPETH